MQPSAPHVIVLIILGIVLLTAAVVIVLWWAGTSGLNGKELVTARFDALKVGLSIGVASGGVFALYLAWRRQQSTEIGLRQKDQDQADVARAYLLQERIAETTKADAADRRVTEQYSKSVEQLGSDKAAVRLGGLYALERLGQSIPALQENIGNLLCAYLRMPHLLPEELPSEPNRDQRDLHNQLTQEQEVRQTALDILIRHNNPNQHGQHWHELRIRLQRANLSNAILADAYLTGANLTGANLTGTNLARANLTRANLTLTKLPGAHLTGANLTGATMIFANLNRADLTSADLTRANLIRARLIRADLADADLTRANLAHADLTHADMRDANLTAANLTRANLTSAKSARANLTDADLTDADLTGVVGLDRAERGSPSANQQI
jgi:uncharacterized protein YjbI with pentapeptide repeats